MQLQSLVALLVAAVALFAPPANTAPTALATLAAAPGCWRLGTGGDVTQGYIKYGSPQTYSFARAYCERVGGALVDSITYEASVWGGFRINASHQAEPYYLSGRPVQADWQTYMTNSTYDAAKECYDSNGTAYVCDDVTTKEVVCQRSLAPTAPDWVRYPADAPLMAYVVVPMGVNRASAKSACNLLGADLGYIPDEAFALQHVFPKAKTLAGLKYYEGVTDSCGTVLGLYTGFNGTGYDAAAEYEQLFPSAGPLGTHFADSCQVVRHNTSGNAQYVPTVGCISGLAAFVCTKRLIQVSASLSATSVALGAGVAQINVALDFASSVTDVTLYPKSSDSTVALPAQSSVTFAKGTTTLTDTIDIVARKGGSATFSIVVDARHASETRGVNWTSTATFTVQVGASVTISPTVIALHPGKTASIGAELSASLASAVAFDVTDPGCAIVGVLRFKPGETVKTINVTALEPCATTTLKFVPNADDGATIDPPSSVSLSVGSPTTFTMSGASSFVMYDGGVDTQQSFTIAPASAMPYPVNVSITTNCSDVITVSPAAILFDANATADVTYTITVSEIVSPLRACDVYYSIDDTDAFVEPATRSISVRQQITIEPTYVPYTFDNTGDETFLFSIPHYWGSSTTTFTLRIDGLPNTINLPGAGTFSPASLRYAGTFDVFRTTSGSSIQGTLYFDITGPDAHTFRPVDKQPLYGRPLVYGGTSLRTFQLLPGNITVLQDEPVTMNITVKSSDVGLLDADCVITTYSNLDIDQSTHAPSSFKDLGGGFHSTSFTVFWKDYTGLTTVTARCTSAAFLPLQVVVTAKVLPRITGTVRWPAEQYHSTVGDILPIMMYIPYKPPQGVVTMDGGRTNNPNFELVGATTVQWSSTDDVIQPQYLFVRAITPAEIITNKRIGVEQKSTDKSFNDKVDIDSIAFYAAANIIVEMVPPTAQATNFDASLTVKYKLKSGTFPSGSGGRVYLRPIARSNATASYTTSTNQITMDKVVGTEHSVTFTFGELTPDYVTFDAVLASANFDASLTVLPVTVPVPVLQFLVAARVGTTDSIASRGTTVKVNVSATQALAANATVNFTVPSWVTANPADSVVLTPEVPSVVIDIDATQAGTVVILFNVTDNGDFTINTTAFTVSFLDLITPTIASDCPLRLFDGMPNPGITVDFPFVGDGHTLLLTPSRFLAAPNELLVSPASHSATSSALQHVFNLDVSAPTTENVTISVATGVVNTYAKTVVSPMIQGRRRMAAGVSAFDPQMYAGVVNRKTLSIAVGAPPEGTVNFDIVVEGTTSSIFSVTQFNVSATDAVGIVDTVLTGAEGANVTFVIVPDNTTYHVNSSRFEVEVLPLNLLELSLDSTSLYGSEDDLVANITIVDPVSKGGDSLVVSFGFNESFAASPAGPFAYTQSTAATTLATVTTDAGFSFATMPIGVAVNVTFGGNQRALYAEPLPVEVTVYDKLTASLTDSAPLGLVYAGELNSKTVRVAVSQLPRLSRKLVLDVNVNGTNDTAVTISPEQLEFNASSPTFFDITVTVTSEAAFNLTVDHNATVSTAKEFLPFVSNRLALEAVTTIPINVTKTTNFTYLRTGASGALEVSTDVGGLQPAEQVSVTFTPDAASAASLSISPAATTTFLPGSGVLMSSITLTPAPGLTAPVHVKLAVNFSGPSNYGPLTTTLLEFYVAPTIDIVTSFPVSPLHQDAPHDRYAVSLTVPPPGNYYSESPSDNLMVNVTCNDTNIRLGASPAGPFTEYLTQQFDATLNVSSLYMDVTGSSDPSYSECVYNFTSALAPEMATEYTTTVFTHTFKTWRQVSIGLTVDSETYAYGNVSYRMVSLTPINSRCTNGQTVNVTMFSTTHDTLIANVDESLTVVSSITNVFDFSGLLPVPVPATTVPVAVFMQLNVSASTCYMFRDPASTPQITVYPPTAITLVSLPSEAFQNTTETFTIKLNPTIAVPGPDNVTIVLTYFGAAGSVILSGENVTEVDVNTWAIEVPKPPPGVDTFVPVNITGAATTPSAGFNCSVQGPAGVALQACAFDTNNETRVLDLVPPEVSSDSPTLNASLYDSPTSLYAGNSTFFVGEQFTIVLFYPADPRGSATVEVNFNSSVFNLISSATTSVSSNFTSVFAFSCINATDSADAGTLITFDIAQQKNLFTAPRNISLVVADPSLIYAVVAPPAVRIGAQNTMNITINVTLPPQRLPLTVSIQQLTGFLVFTPPTLVWQVGEVGEKSVVARGVLTSDYAPITVVADTPEYQVDAALRTYALRVLPLGTIQIANARSILFEEQSMVLGLTPDFPPISQPVSVELFFDSPGGVKHVTIDYSIDGLLKWDVGQLNTTKSVEVFADIATNPEGSSYPMLFRINSTEFTAIECVDGNCTSLAVMQPAVPDIPGGGDTRKQIIFVGDTYTFDIAVPRCYQSVIEATPTLIDSPDAVQFQPSKLSWDCTNAASGAAQQVTVLGLGNEAGTDPTNGRASTIELEVSETLAGAPPSFSIKQLRLLIEVRAPEIIAVTTGSVLYFGSQLLVEFKPKRYPAAGNIGLAVVPRSTINGQVLPANQFVISAPVTYVPTVTSGVANPDLGVVTIEQTAGIGQRVNLTYNLTGPSASEFYLERYFDTIITRRPKTLRAELVEQGDTFIRILYEATMTIEEAPDTNTLLSVGFGAKIWNEATQQWVDVAEGDVEFTPPFVAFTPSSNLTLPFRFRVHKPGIYSIQYATPPDATPLAKFNMTVESLSLARVTIRNSIAPQVTTIRDTQFMMERNAQTFAVALAASPLGAQQLVARPEVRGVAGMEVILKPAFFTFTAPPAPTNESVSTRFTLYTPVPLTVESAVVEIWMTFDNTTTAEFNQTSLFVGRVKFVPLHYIKPPPTDSWSIFVGQSIEIPATVSDVPPAFAASVAEYVVALSIPLDELGRDLAFTYTPRTVGWVKNDSATEVKTFVVTARATGTYTLRFSSETKLGFAPSFDTSRTRSHAMTIRVSPLFAPELRLDGAAITSLRTYVDAQNTKTIGFYMPVFDTFDPTISSIAVAVSFTVPGYIRLGSDEDKLFTMDKEAAYPVTKTLDIIGVLPTSNLTAPPEIVFTLSGSPRFVSEVRMPITVNALIGFDVFDFPTSVFVGDLNMRSFSMLPRAVPFGGVKVLVTTTCEGGVDVNPASAFWNTTVPRPAFFTVRGISPTSDCSITIQQDATMLSPTMESIALLENIVIIAAPELALRLGGELVVREDIPASMLRERDIPIRLLLEFSTFVDLANLTIGTDNSSSITVYSSLNVSDAPFGAQALLLSDRLRFITDINSQRKALSLTLLRVPEYTTFAGENLYFQLNARAIVNGTEPTTNGAKRAPHLRILPDEKAPPTRTERQALEATTFTAAAVSGLASLSAASQVARVLTIGAMSDCPSDNWIKLQDDMPVYLSPTGLSLGGNDVLGGYAGAALANTLLWAAVGLVHYAATRGLAKLRGSGHSFDKVCATLKFPALSGFPIVILYQVTLTSASVLLLYSPSTTFKLLGSAIFLITAVGLPGGLFAIYSKTRRLQYTPPDRRGWRNWLFARGTHVDPNDETWVDRFGFPFYQMRAETRWYFLVDVAIMITLALITAVHPKNFSDCIARSSAAMLIFILQLGLMILVQPFAAKFDNFFFMVGYAVQAAAMGVILWASTQGTEKFEEAYELSGRILLIFAAMLTIKAVIDWWRLVVSGLAVCAVLDPLAERNFKSAQDEKADSTTFFQQDHRKRLLDESALSRSAAFARDVDVADVTCTTHAKHSDGSVEVMTGFRRAMHPMVAALSGEHSRVAVMAHSAPDNVDFDSDDSDLNPSGGMGQSQPRQRITGAAYEAL